MILEKMSKQIVNLGGTIPMSLNNAAKLLCKITGATDIQYAEARHEVKHAIPSYQKSIDLLEYNEKYDIEYGLREMYEWAKT